MLVAKEKFGKKGKGDSVFTDDGFAIGIEQFLFGERERERN
jgi:hypothetical protein